jgi:alpha-tubulin suppressor-like RCC1 family protein
MARISTGIIALAVCSIITTSISADVIDISGTSEVFGVNNGGKLWASDQLEQVEQEWRLYAGVDTTGGFDDTEWIRATVSQFATGESWVSVESSFVNGGGALCINVMLSEHYELEDYDGWNPWGLFVEPDFTAENPGFISPNHGDLSWRLWPGAYRFNIRQDVDCDFVDWIYEDVRFDYFLTPIPVASTVPCWGDNFHEQCLPPTDLDDPVNPVASVAAGYGHTVAVLADGSVACWGYNYSGQCTVPSGIGTPENPVASIAAGGDHTVAVLADGSVACWGWNGYGQCDVPFGIGTPENPVASVAAGDLHTGALLADGSVACWGDNDSGQCDVPTGIGTPENPVASVAAGGYHTVALLADGSVACWGDNYYGQCIVPGGIGTPENPVASVAAGYGHTVAVLSDGSVACWGYNDVGQCTVPAGIGTPENPVASVAAGGLHTAAVLADGSVACWGAGTTNTGLDSDFGQSIVPTGIGTPENPVMSVAAGWVHTVAVLETSAVCLGDLTGDRAVDGGDLGVLFGAWGPCVDCAADLNADGAVDGGDLGVLFGAWGPCA